MPDHRNALQTMPTRSTRLMTQPATVPHCRRCLQKGVHYCRIATRLSFDAIGRYGHCVIATTSKQAKTMMFRSPFCPYEDSVRGSVCKSMWQNRSIKEQQSRKPRTKTTPTNSLSLHLPDRIVTGHTCARSAPDWRVSCACCQQGE